MLANLISQKGFMIKIGVLLCLLFVGRTLREDSSLTNPSTQVTKAESAPSPLVLATSNLSSFFPTSEISSSLN